jgi:hypothetical protein
MADNGIPTHFSLDYNSSPLRTIFKKKYQICDLTSYYTSFPQFEGQNSKNIYIDYQINPFYIEYIKINFENDEKNNPNLKVYLGEKMVFKAFSWSDLRKLGEVSNNKHFIWYDFPFHPIFVKNNVYIESDLNMKLDCKAKFPNSEVERKRILTCSQEIYFHDLYYEKLISDSDGIIDLSHLNMIADQIIVKPENENINEKARMFFNNKEISIPLEFLFLDSDFTSKLNYHNHPNVGDFKLNNQPKRGDGFILENDIIYMSSCKAGAFALNKNSNINISYPNQNVEIWARFRNIIQDGKILYSPFVWKKNSNNYPLIKLNPQNGETNRYKEGFWQEIKITLDPDDTLPFPVEDLEPNNELFKSNLKSIIKYLKKYGNYSSDNGWGKIISYLGCSYSRLHPFLHVGDNEFIVNHNGETFIFPEGLTHYYIKHNVHPSSGFKQFVENLNI